MYKIILLLIASILVLVSCATAMGVVEEDSQPLFKRIADIPEGKCVVYVYRLPSMVGAAVNHNVKVFAARETGFPEDGKFVYAYLQQKGYIPIVLDSGKLYRINAAGLLYFKGESGSETVYKVKGTGVSFDCIKGNISAYQKRMLSPKLEEKIFAGESILENYSENTDPKYFEELSVMHLASVLRPYIYE